MATGSRTPGRFARLTSDKIWLGPTQQVGLTHLCANTQIKTLLGPSSCGKTTLLRHFQHHLSDARTLHISGPYADASELLSDLLKAASLETTGLTESEQRNLLRVFIERQNLLGMRVIICADEVSGFSSAAWNEIDSLVALETYHKPLVELAFAGTLDDSSSASLKRIIEKGSISAVEAVRYLSPPSENDIRQYINWQLARIGMNATFTPKAYSRINQLSNNKFAIINDLCDTIISSPETIGALSFGVETVDNAADFLAEPPSSTETLPVAGDEACPNCLIIWRNGEVDRVVHLDRQLLIGRGETSDIKLTGKHLSRHHAMISSTGDGRFIVVDLNSSNGTLVNGERVRRHILRKGDIVQLCEYSLKLTNETAARGQAVTSAH